jgi:hypothetical protein
MNPGPNFLARWFPEALFEIPFKIEFAAGVE